MDSNEMNQHIINELNRKFGHITPRKLTGTFKCVLTQLKKADSKLDLLEKTDKGQYVQRVLLSLINNKCTLNILRALPYDLIGVVLDRILVQMTKNMIEIENNISKSGSKADKTFKEMKVFDKMFTSVGYYKN